MPKRLYDVKCNMSRPDLCDLARCKSRQRDFSRGEFYGVSIASRFFECIIDNPAFFRLFEGEIFSVARRSAEKAAVTRASRQYRPADCLGGYERRCPSIHHVRDKIFQPDLNGIYFQARIFRGILSVRQGLHILPRFGKPIASGIHSVIWETESNRSIKNNIAIHQAAVRLWTKIPHNVIHPAVILCKRE